MELSSYTSSGMFVVANLLVVEQLGFITSAGNSSELIS